MIDQETLNLLADDILFFGRTFFKRAFRQKSPLFHEDIAYKLNTRGNKIFKVFRGGAKTTLTRVAAAHRVSFGMSRTMQIVGKGQDHAIRSVQWLKNAVVNNRKWADTFQLRPALDPVSGKKKKWTDEHICIYNGILDVEVHVVAVGIMGQVRGVNLEDYRPDYIICDDILDDENCGSVEQRDKAKSRFHGALMNSLERVEDNPDAQVVMLQTPIDADDLCEELCKSPMWQVSVYSCLTEEGESTWPERFSTENLKAQKNEMARSNQLSVWMREMEVKITAQELKLFRSHWLTDHFYESLDRRPIVILSVDPTPPPKDSKQRDVQKLDDAVIHIWGYIGGHFFLLDRYATKSPQTMELINKIFEFYIRWTPSFVAVETILFARTIKEWLEREMQLRGIFFTVIPVEDKRKKYIRIKDTMQGLASQGRLHVKPEHVEFIEQFNDYPQVQHDDELDAASIAIMQINPAMLALGDVIDGEYMEIETDAPRLDFGGAP